MVPLLLHCLFFFFTFGLFSFLTWLNKTKRRENVVMSKKKVTFLDVLGKWSSSQPRYSLQELSWSCDLKIKCSHMFCSKLYTVIMIKAISVYSNKLCVDHHRASDISGKLIPSKYSSAVALLSSQCLNRIHIVLVEVCRVTWLGSWRILTCEPFIISRAQLFLLV